MIFIIICKIYELFFFVIKCIILLDLYRKCRAGSAIILLISRITTDFYWISIYQQINFLLSLQLVKEIICNVLCKKNEFWDIMYVICWHFSIFGRLQDFELYTQFPDRIISLLCQVRTRFLVTIMSLNELPHLFICLEYLQKKRIDIISYASF